MIRDGAVRCVPALVLLIATALLFARLDHYALWDDEANTALSGKAVLRSGDTGAWVDDHNLLAFRQGAELRDLKLRYVPPLQAYLAAAGMALFGETALGARLPFALCGLATIALLLTWLVRSGAGTAMRLLMSLGIAGNVSLFLYLRQCRYYALAALCSLLLAYCHVRRPRYWLAGMLAASIALLATNDLNYGAALLCLGVDYFFWGRHENPLSRREWIWLLVPQLFAAAVLLAVWNPFVIQVAPDPGDWLVNRGVLLWWNLRDLDRCEFGALVLLLAPAVLSRDRPWLRRAGTAFAVYVAAIALASPQPVGLTSAADVRYLAPLIPLCLFIQSDVLLALTRQPVLLAALGVVAFGTNLLNSAMVQAGPHSTPVRYVRELLDPPPDPYTAASAWIRANVKAGQSVLVLPGYKTYPLMFHAPDPVYAGQLAWPPAPQFRDLPPVHFAGRVRPDFIVAFGPAAGLLAADDLRDARRVATLDVYWDDTYRPELIWRRFAAVTGYDRRTEAVQIFQRATSGTSGSSTTSAVRSPGA